MPIYHFDCGNSTEGPIGFCARIKAKNKILALKRLKYLLPEYEEVGNARLKDSEYIQVYFGKGNITASDIDFIER